MCRCSVHSRPVLATGARLRTEGQALPETLDAAEKRLGEERRCDVSGLSRALLLFLRLCAPACRPRLVASLLSRPAAKVSVVAARRTACAASLSRAQLCRPPLLGHWVDQQVHVQLRKGCEGEI
ncbi:hypothetical protein HPB48_002104 [Haemaphysalis longicornis]|uniref:Uncharacterized protein n=1 Tax=Haemaphysalis longicornis TaxID=44386 RepID=A0A9J6F7J6_HAELO|nr:hypothetical protein HPB48_002104 [Haemaphysalis longicornis]